MEKQRIKDQGTNQGPRNESRTKGRIKKRDLQTPQRTEDPQPRISNPGSPQASTTSGPKDLLSRQVISQRNQQEVEFT
jgi:hypothetical protein